MTTSSGSGEVMALGYFERLVVEKEVMVCAKTREKCMSSEPCFGRNRGYRFVCPLCLRVDGENLNWDERRVHGM
jgi:hypothetical protein